MKKLIISLIISCFIFLFSISFTFAAPHKFRCGPKLVSIGDTSFEVFIKCGEPTASETTGAETVGRIRGRRVYMDSKDTVYTEIWYYNCGKNEFIRILTFEGGVLNSIELGGYGTGKSDCVGAEKR